MLVLTGASRHAEGEFGSEHSSGASRLHRRDRASVQRHRVQQSRSAPDCGDAISAIRGRRYPRLCGRRTHGSPRSKSSRLVSGPPLTRAGATVLFTDIVGSAKRAAELGDRRWKELLDKHDRAVRSSSSALVGGRSIQSETASWPPSTDRIEPSDALCHSRRRLGIGPRSAAWRAHRRDRATRRRCFRDGGTNWRASR
jgi:hypothetical protein